MWAKSPEVDTCGCDNVKVNASQAGGGTARTVPYLSKMLHENGSTRKCSLETLGHKYTHREPHTFKFSKPHVSGRGLWFSLPALQLQFHRHIRKKPSPPLVTQVRVTIVHVQYLITGVSIVVGQLRTTIKHSLEILGVCQCC